jgi:hypothetical protein
MCAIDKIPQGVYIYNTSGGDKLCKECAETTQPFSLVDGWLLIWDKIVSITITGSSDIFYCDGCNQTMDNCRSDVDEAL